MFSEEMALSSRLEDFRPPAWVKIGSDVGAAVEMADMAYRGGG